MAASNLGYDLWSWSKSNPGLRVEDVVAAGMKSYRNALGPRIDLTESVYWGVESKAKKILALKERLRVMIENSNNDQLVCNLSLLYASLDETLDQHEEMLARYQARREAGVIPRRKTLSTAVSTSAVPKPTIPTFPSSSKLSPTWQPSASSPSLYAYAFPSVTPTSSSSTTPEPATATPATTGNSSSNSSDSAITVESIPIPIPTTPRKPTLDNDKGKDSATSREEEASSSLNGRKWKNAVISRSFEGITAEAELSLDKPKRGLGNSLRLRSSVDSALEVQPSSSVPALVDRTLEKPLVLSTKSKSLAQLRSGGGVGGELILTKSSSITDAVLRKARVTECPICYTDCPVKEVYTFLKCSHYYCLECLRTYYRTALDEGRVLGIHCPTPGCETEVEIGDMAAIMEAEWVQRYEDIALLAVLRLDPNCRWCPRPGCGTSILVTEGSVGAVECPQCQTQICSECGREFHPDMTCQDVALEEMENDSDEKKLQEWAVGKAKKCPGCHALTEKHHGCNHMTCISCNHQWCWLCLGTYDLTHFEEGQCAGKQFSSEQDPEYDDEDPEALNWEEDAMGDDWNEHFVYLQRRRRWRRVRNRIGLCVAGVVVLPVVAPVALGVILYGTYKSLME